jgi:hypothetical protein
MGGGARRLCITTDDGGSDEYQTLAGEVVHNFVRGGSGGGDLLVSFGDSQSRKYLRLKNTPTCKQNTTN